MTHTPAQDLLDRIASGSTLFIHTYTRITKVDQRCVERFAKVGIPVLKNGADGRLRMASGRSFVLIDGCSLVFA